jgi:hypothetical protein
MFYANKCDEKESASDDNNHLRWPEKNQPYFCEKQYKRFA